MKGQADHDGHHPALADQVAQGADVGDQSLAVERADRERDDAGGVGYGQADPAFAEVESEHGALHRVRSYLLDCARLRLAARSLQFLLFSGGLWPDIFALSSLTPAHARRYPGLV